MEGITERYNTIPACLDVMAIYESIDMRSLTQKQGTLNVRVN
jgi:hypothetical protein